MEDMRKELAAWGKELECFNLPRWDQLPDLELYMDQVIKLVDQYLSPVIQADKHTLLTKSMVNNYVKLGMIPAPQRKRYTRKHVAFLVAITNLKQVLTIPEIKEGILFQGRVHGIRAAYNIFCEEQEKAVYRVAKQAQGIQPELETEPYAIELMAAKSASAAFANRLIAEKAIALEMEYMKKGKGKGEKNEQ